MYSIIFYDTNMNKLNPDQCMRVFQQDSSAIHFIHCVGIFVDCLNGGKELNTLFSSINSSATQSANRKLLDSNLTPIMALPIFVSELHKHRDFDPKDIGNPNNLNKDCFSKIAALMQSDIRDSSINLRMIEIIQSFRVSGIGKIVIKNEMTVNHQKLIMINFPEELLPEEYLCKLIGEVMDKACYDKINSNVLYEQKSIVRHLTTNPKNPHTNTPLKQHDLILNVPLQDEINQFVLKANFISELFIGDRLTDHYRTHIDLIKSAKDVVQLKLSLRERVTPLLKAKYKINGNTTFIDKENIEKGLRRAAAEGNKADLILFVKLFNVPVNSQDHKLGKTALHWIMQRASEAFEKNENNKLSRLLDCFEYLMENGGNLEIRDKNDVTAGSMYFSLKERVDAQSSSLSTAPAK